MRKPRIFVSHSHQDNDFGFKLVRDLRHALGDESAVWYDTSGGLHGGDVWWQTILQELVACDFFIVVLSPDAMQSKWVNREIDIALNEGKRIIPLLYRDCTLRIDLKIIQTISFLNSASDQKTFNDLLEALGLPTSVEAKKLGNNVEAASPPLAETSRQSITSLERMIKAWSIGKRLQAEFSPKDALDYNWRGVAHFPGKRFEKAITEFNRALELDPQLSVAYYNRGVAYFSLKENQKALADFSRALTLDPTYAPAYNGRGVAYLELKEYQKAIIELDRALALDSSLTVAKRNREAASRLLRGE